MALPWIKQVLAVSALSLAAGCSGSPASVEKADPATPAGESSGTPSATSEEGAETPTFTGTLAIQTDKIVLVDPGGRNQRAAAPSTPPGQEAPDWSPDGTRLAFEVTHTSIWVAEIDGAAKEVFTCSRPCWRVQHPSWSPDGTGLAFMVAETKNGSTTSRAAVVTMDLATSTVSTAYEDTSGRVWVYGPRWSPDGLQLVFEADTFATIC